MRLRLHYKHTHEAYYKAKELWNQQCKEKFTKQEVRTDKRGRTYVWREYRAHLLKGEHDRTFIALTQAFQVHCNKVIELNHNEDKPFFTYIKSLATMVDKDESTINRHLHRLQDAGIITEWFSYGLKNSVQIKIHDKILHAEPSGDIRELLVKNWDKNVNNCQFDSQNKPIEVNNYIFLKRSFSDCYALSLAFCKRFEEYKIQKRNNNMTSGKTNTPSTPHLLIASGKQEPLKQEQGRMTAKNDALLQPFIAQAEKNKAEQQKDRYGREMSFFVTLAINFMLRVLYSNRTFLPVEMKRTREKMIEIFRESQSYQTKLDDFNEIILSKARYNEKNSWIEKDPSEYLDKNNKNGYYLNQKFFFNVTIPQRKKNEKYFSNRRLFAECFRMYAEDQNNYFKIAQLLGKKQKNKDEKVKWLDLFNEHFVINRQKLTSLVFTEIHKQQYERKP